jgi:predicted RNA-binding Zn-ribbon protein involved in translation (DUF1610 family)
MQGSCPNCGLVNLTVGQQVGGKLAFALGGAALGGQGMKSPIAMLFFGLAGLAIGHYVDTTVAKRCPQCGQLLQIVAFAL